MPFWSPSDPDFLLIVLKCPCNSVKKEKTPPTENRFQPVGCLFLPRAFPRMSGTDLVGDNAIRTMDLPAGHILNNAGYHPV